MIEMDYQNLLSRLQRGDPADVLELLWQPAKGRIKYLPVTSAMLEKMKRPPSASSDLSIHRRVANEDYELIILHLPWGKSDLPYSPIVVHNPTGRIVGIMLLFNELHGLISERDSGLIGELGVKWVLFTMTVRSGGAKQFS